MQQTITLPYLRTSPVHLPRRDLVLSASDSLLLSIVVVENDRPSAQTLILTTDADGPAMQLVIWNESHHQSGSWDYGHWWNYGPTPGAVLQSVSGTPGSAGGSWDFHLPTGTFSDVPLRCGWTILLVWAKGAKTEVLAQGIINVLRPFLRGVPLNELPPEPIPPIVPPVASSLLRLVTDDLHPIITSDSVHHLETS